MAGGSSFDVTTGVDLMEVTNAVEQATRELAQRYDFKGANAGIALDPKAKTLTLTAPDDYKLGAAWDLLQTKLVKRKVPLRYLKPGTAEAAAGGTRRQVVQLQQGLTPEMCRDVVRALKDAKLRKVQAAIQGDAVRVSGASKDDLQAAIALLRGQDFGVELKIGNFRTN